MNRIALTLGMMTLLAAAPASAGKTPAAITGTWVFEYNGITLSMVLKPDGNGTFNEEPLTWSYAGTTLTIKAGGQTETYQAVLRGDSLELSGGDLPQTATFRRQGGAPAAPTAPAAPEPPKAEGGAIVGTWAYTQGATTVLLELAGDGSGKFNGVALRWQLDGATLNVTANGQTMAYQVAVRGNQLDVSGGDLPQPVTLQRRGAPAPAARPAAPATLVGTWIYDGGNVQYSLELAADGSGKFNGGALRWKQAGTTLTITAPNGQSMAYKAVLRGDQLDMSGGDLPGPATLRRQGSGPSGPTDSTGLAGVYSCTESSVDPSIVMVYTQYVTLYPDGTVGYQKTEGGGQRMQVTQTMERFRSWHQGGPPAGNAGRWESDGNTITVRWRYWNNLVSQGRVDLASGRFQLSGMGVLNEGATLTFKRE